MGPLGGHEGGALMSMISALIRGGRELSCPLLPCENAARRCLLQTKKRALIRLQICQHLDLELLSFQNLLLLINLSWASLMSLVLSLVTL